MDTTLELITKLRNCFDEYAGGIANPPAFRQVESILHSISMSCHPNSYAREKIGNIREYSGMYFIARIHQSIQGGAGQAKAFFLGDIDSLESALEVRRFE